jgi:hypothetical protein
MTGVAVADLEQLAAAVRTAHAAVEHAAVNLLGHALAAGDALIAAKARLPHGEFGNWIDRNCDLSERTAQRYMVLAGARAQLEANPTRVSDLSLRGALALVRPKSGKRITTADVRAAIAASPAPMPASWTEPAGDVSEAPAAAESAAQPGPAPRRRKSRSEIEAESAERFAFMAHTEIDLLVSLREEQPEKFAAVLGCLVGHARCVDDLSALARDPNVQALISQVAAKAGAASDVGPSGTGEVTRELDDLRHKVSLLQQANEELSDEIRNLREAHRRARPLDAEAARIADQLKKVLAFLQHPEQHVDAMRKIIAELLRAIDPKGAWRLGAAGWRLIGRWWGDRMGRGWWSKWPAGARWLTLVSSGCTARLEDAAPFTWGGVGGRGRPASRARGLK